MRRRDFLKNMLTGAAAASLGAAIARPAWAAAKELRIVRRILEVNGTAAPVFGLVGADDRPGTRFRAGETFDVVLRNETAEDTIVHWHGLTPPWAMDGVANAPLPLLPAGGSRQFDFAVGSAGTHWMHAHTLQHQALLAAPLIVEEAQPVDEQEVVMLLHDLSFTPAEELLHNLQHGGHDMGGMMGIGGMMGMDHNMPGMDHAAMVHANDIEYDAYLANDRTLADPKVVPVESGGRVRLSIINGAAATAYHVDFGELNGTLIAVDGKDVDPIRATRFPVGMGQRLDVRLQLPAGARAFPILALREAARERTGLILRQPGAAVAKLAEVAARSAPAINLNTEIRLRAEKPLADRAPDRDFAVTLVGGMNVYEWAMQGKEPLLVRTGERAEITLHNMSTMTHPMHLHGHAFQVVAFDGWRFDGAVRDTVLVPPMRSVTIAVDADNPGLWASHCHHLYHMAAGMMATLAYQT
jgi:FtsP/CotA-like multicopper oxidase with cupredoxin domain